MKILFREYFFKAKNTYTNTKSCTVGSLHLIDPSSAFGQTKIDFIGGTDIVHIALRALHYIYWMQFKLCV